MRTDPYVEFKCPCSVAPVPHSNVLTHIVQSKPLFETSFVHVFFACSAHADAYEGVFKTQVLPTPVPWNPSEIRIRKDDDFEYYDTWDWNDPI